MILYPKEQQSYRSTKFKVQTLRSDPWARPLGQTPGPDPWIRSFWKTLPWTGLPGLLAKTSSSSQTLKKNHDPLQSFEAWGC